MHCQAAEFGEVVVLARTLFVNDADGVHPTGDRHNSTTKEIAQLAVGARVGTFNTNNCHSLLATALRPEITIQTCSIGEVIFLQ